MATPPCSPTPTSRSRRRPISGHLKVGKKWTYKGRSHPYVNARCETGKLEAKGEFTFGEGARLEGTFFKPGTVRG